MPFTTLVDVATLAAHAGDPSWAIVDCRFALEDPDWGEREYGRAHVPGAVYAHLERDLSGPRNGTNGRHPLPAPDDLARTFGAWGIGSGVQVVAYDQDAGMYASRLWWLLRWLGHDHAAVLDGGLARWTAAGEPTSHDRPRRPSCQFAGSPRADMAASAGEAARTAGSRDARLIDARAPERFRGEVEPLDRKAGHIPGAVNHFFRRNVREDGVFRPAAALRDEWLRTLGHLRPEDAVCYCGSGVTACHNLLAMELAGLHGARLYPGSWSEWSADPSRPVATGAEDSDGDR